jgi:hypothetical protein
MLFLTLVSSILGSVFLLSELNKKIGLDNRFMRRARCFPGKTMVVILWIFELALAIPLAFAISAAICAVVIVPTYLFYIYKLFKIGRFLHLADAEEVEGLPPVNNEIHLENHQEMIDNRSI